MEARIVILGAGFGGLELATLLSERLGEHAGVTLIDKSDAFIMGYSKLDVMFGHKTLDAVRLPYKHFARPGVRFVQEVVSAIDPTTRRVTTDAGVHEADFLVVALGADYDLAATPGLEAANEFYSVAGASRLREVLVAFDRGRALIGVCGAPYKCPPAPSECALLLHDMLTRRGVRAHCEIDFVSPLPSPVPPSPETSQALLAAFAERQIRFTPGHRINAVDTDRGVATLDDGTEMPFDLFLGVPRHRAPAVVEAAGLVVDGWVPVNPRTLATRFDRVFAIGDIAATGAPKAGVFAEGAARAVAGSIVAHIHGTTEVLLFDGAGTCYIEFGSGTVGRVDVDFFSGPKPTGTYHAPDAALRVDKERFGSSRRARWFAL